MLDIDQIRHIHSIKVCDGSGVLVRPVDKSILYVFTNYHVVVDKDSGCQNTLQFSFDKDSPLYSSGIKVLDLLKDEPSDVAIIKISADGLDSVPHLCFNSKPTSLNCHVGFPKARDNGDAINGTIVLHISAKCGSVGEFFEEYSYVQPMEKEVLEGSSGGGIFDSDFNLVGIHKQSSNLDTHECLGYGVYVKIECYRSLLKKNKWALVGEFDLDSFRDILPFVFHIKESGVAKSAKTLLYSLESYKKKIYDLSPEKLINILTSSKRLPEDFNLDDVNRAFWVDFTEFLIGVMIVCQISEKQENFIIDIYDQCHFIYSTKPFDVFEAREKLDIKLLYGYRESAILFIGGLEMPSSFRHSAIQSELMPNIAKPRILDKSDIARSNKYFLYEMTIVNAKIFNKAIPYCVDLSDEVSIDLYKKTLSDKLFPQCVK